MSMTCANQKTFVKEEISWINNLMQILQIKMNKEILKRLDNLLNDANIAIKHTPHKAVRSHKSICLTVFYFVTVNSGQYFSELRNVTVNGGL